MSRSAGGASASAGWASPAPASGAAPFGSPSASSTAKGAARQQAAVASSRAAAQDDSRSLLTSLTENAQLAPAIKAIYDRGWKDTYEADLERSVALREEDIIRTSGEHCDEVLTTVESLLTVREDLSALRSVVDTLNSTVQDTGADLVESAEDALHHRLVRHNIGITLHVISACVRVFDMLSKAIDHIGSKKFFSAIKALRTLQVRFTLNLTLTACIFILFLMWIETHLPLS